MDDTAKPANPEIRDNSAAQPAPVDAFIARWASATGTERANYQLFLTELCALLELPQPDPAREDNQDNAYCFERRVVFHHGDGTQSHGFIDLYRRACYVLEAKQSGLHLDTPGWDKAMLRAHGQAVQYVRALPSEEGRPPFVIAVDVGRSIELYSEFSRSGGAYIPFPDPRGHRIRLADLRDAEIRARLRAVWLDPLSLDPSRRAARVTREIAARLARLAVSLEAAGHPPELTAAFLIRCLFTLFAEDVGLIKQAGFTELLASVRDNPVQFVPLAEHLWRDMNAGSPFSPILRERVPRFNGGLFADPSALPLDRDQIDLLIEAGRADWRQVEPAIFGTLLERALDPLERHKLGAHYTPRAYVERLVLPTVIEPLREEWTAVQSAAVSLHEQGKDVEAARLARGFQVRLANVRVLDPACGSGNFLYVTLEHLKRLEGEVLDTLESLGAGQTLLDMEGVSVDPHQLLGLELNPRAATIAEMVLWIGYLQWHVRTHGSVHPPEPIIRDFRNIQCRDAVLAYDRMEWVTDATGQPVSRWDGRTMKTHPITGEPVPDETARTPLERYVNPRRAEWPEADFVVGNPPFIGASNMRRALGDGYVDALRGVRSEVPESADYVMYWWDQAAGLARAAQIRRFGFITTNSLRQTFNRRVLERHLTAAEPLSLLYAVPDHPWVDAADGAAVRIGMTVGQAGELHGLLDRVTAERGGQGEGLDVDLERTAGFIHADLRIGANVTAALPLRANQGISSPGVKLHGAGFIVTREEAASLGLGRLLGLERHIRAYLNGRDLTQSPRGVMVIDLFGLAAEEVRVRYPEVYQWVLERVKPERDANNRAAYRENWWVFGEPRNDFRPTLVGLPRYIATVETAKHRTFVFLDQSILPDNKLIAIALSGAWKLGVLSSRIHVFWALATGSRLGVGNDPVYVKTRCFETFPFPDASEPIKSRIRQLGEDLDAHRKQRQALHPDLTMTGMYNVLDRLRRGEPLTAKEKTIHAQGLVAVLRQLHDELDAAVLDAYGWSDLTDALLGAAPGSEAAAEVEEGILQRLVALNAERAAEERRGLVRWLRPEFQRPSQGAEEAGAAGQEAVPPIVPAAAGPKPAWPKTLPEQFQALRAALTASPGPATPVELAKRFTRAPKAKVAELLDTLASLGHARCLDDGRYLPG
ncbi:class I SAM-dependent DNA methyltransferase [Thiocystis violacea]|uniref:class I SAM-dependent DNA methyltransferase n=1 Tax=Thiocystis violacea TaxID=13725 RepID=UPI00190742E7|nr:class I SAM-dependent DNA methyltransferase [Thiocystis violacea]MBK1720839.1 SAM-dependent methyltransferase [Thiocystis violacea]